MRRIDDQARKDIAQDLYGLGGTDAAIMGGAHVIANSIDNLSVSIHQLSDKMTDLSDKLDALSIATTPLVDPKIMR